jgi:hypothetical protein
MARVSFSRSKTMNKNHEYFTTVRSKKIQCAGIAIALQLYTVKNIYLVKDFTSVCIR